MAGLWRGLRYYVAAAGSLGLAAAAAVALALTLHGAGLPGTGGMQTAAIDVVEQAPAAMSDASGNSPGSTPATSRPRIIP